MAKVDQLLSAALLPFLFGHSRDVRPKDCIVGVFLNNLGTFPGVGLRAPPEIDRLVGLHSPGTLSNELFLEFQSFVVDLEDLRDFGGFNSKGRGSDVDGLVESGLGFALELILLPFDLKEARGVDGAGEVVKGGGVGRQSLGEEVLQVFLIIDDIVPGGGDGRDGGEYILGVTGVTV